MNLALALVVVLAQVQSGGMEMPDPRQMSGQPRADEAVPAGVLTVRVVRGEFTAPAPAGTMVHLVGLSADGKISLSSKPVESAEGRVTFTGLDREGRVAYYALTSFGGDRIESQVIQLPPEVGVRVALVGRKLGADGQPTGDAVDDRMGGTGEVPAGEVWVSVTGHKPRQVELLRLGPEGKTERVAQAAPEAMGDMGEFAAKLPVGATPDYGGVYVVGTELGGRRLVSTPFMLREGVGTGAFLFTYEGVFFGIHAAGELDDERYWLESQMRILNPHATPWIGDGEGFLITLPAGHQSARVKEEHFTTRTKIEPGEGVRWLGPLPPGRLSVTITWSHPATDGAVDVAWPLPHGLMDGTLILAHYPGMSLSEVNGAQKRQVPLGNGRLYDVLSGLQRKAGESLVVSVAGLPQHPKGQKRAAAAVGLLVLVVLGWTVFTSVSGQPPEAVAAPSDPTARRRTLDEEKEKLYAALVELERRHREDAVEDSDYRRERTGVVSRLVLIHRELDELRAAEKVSTTRRKPVAG